MKTFYIKNKQNGFITMFSVLIFGVVAIAIGSSIILSGIGFSKVGFLIEEESEAKAITNLCAESALQEIRNDTAFVGSNTISIGPDSCTYNVIDNGAENRTITSNGTVGTIVRKIS